MKAIKYTDTQLCFIKEHSKLPRQELTVLFNQKFGRTVNKSNISALCKRNGWLTGRTGRFLKGQIPVNAGKKTGVIPPNAFPKGNRPHNATHVGDERITTDGYKKTKIAEPNKWVFTHRLVWEKHHGTIAQGYAIIFKDGNALNCGIDNLIKVTRFELSTLNKLGYKNAHGEIKPSLLALSKLKQIIKERSE